MPPRIQSLTDPTEVRAAVAAAADRPSVSLAGPGQDGSALSSPDSFESRYKLGGRDYEGPDRSRSKE